MSGQKRTDAEIVDYGQRLSVFAAGLMGIDENCRDLQASRDTLMRIEAALGHLVGQCLRYGTSDAEMTARIRRAWRCTGEAVKEVDAAVVVLHAPLNETPNVSARHLHDATIRAAEGAGDGE